MHIEIYQIDFSFAHSEPDIDESMIGCGEIADAIAFVVGVAQETAVVADDALAIDEAYASNLHSSREVWDMLFVAGDDQFLAFKS